MQTLAQRRAHQRTTLRRQQVEALRQQLRTLLLYAPPTKQCLSCHAAPLLSELSPTQRHAILVQTIDTQELCPAHLQDYLLNTVTHIQQHPECFWDLLSQLPDSPTAKGFQRRLLIAKQLFLSPPPQLIPHLITSFQQATPFLRVLVGWGLRQPPLVMHSCNEDIVDLFNSMATDFLLEMLLNSPELLLPLLGPDQLDQLIDQCHNYRKVAVYESLLSFQTELNTSTDFLATLLAPHFASLSSLPQSSEIADILMRLLAALVDRSGPQTVPSLESLLAVNAHRVSKSVRPLWEYLSSLVDIHREEGFL